MAGPILQLRMGGTSGGVDVVSEVFLVRADSTSRPHLVNRRPAVGSMTQSLPSLGVLPY